MEAKVFDTLEFSFRGPETGNPFTDVTLDAELHVGAKTLWTPGFYAGGGIYKVKVMPDSEGFWSVTLRSDAPALDGQRAEFVCRGRNERSHGPVRAADSMHLAYADGTPYHELGTTCYVWNHQPKALKEKTLSTLRGSPFNKLRMCVFPKHYRYNHNSPEFYAFEGNETDGFDLTRFDVRFWDELERDVASLEKLGIEADLILFHPYDKWGFSKMPREADARYLRYCVARLWAYPNVWWSFANEFDFMRDKTDADFDFFGELVSRLDPAGHMRGIHNGFRFFDHGKAWVTHCSVQSAAIDRIPEWREKYRKPIVIDECRYEGDISDGWGNLTGAQLVDQFWSALMNGAYCGHGETYLNDREELWWSKGGELVGTSPARLAFLAEFLRELPADFAPLPGGIVSASGGVGSVGKQYLCYMGNSQSRSVEFALPDDGSYEAELIDTWNMTARKYPGVYCGKFTLETDRVPFCAIRLRRV